MVNHIETAEASVCTQAVGEMGMSHSNGCWESRHMDHPWDRLLPEPEPLDTQKDCIVQDMEPAPYLHNFEDCIAVSDPGAEAAIGRNSEDYTSGAVDTGQHMTARKSSFAESQHCCSDMRPATVAPVRRHAADCRWPGLDIAVAAAEAAEVPVGPGNLHSGLAGIDGIFLGSGWTKAAAGMDRLGSKT